MNKAHTRMSQLLEMGLHPSNDQEFFNLVQAFPELWGQVKREVFGMNKIIVRATYAVVTEESAELGDYAETGWDDEEGTEYTFRELVDLLQGTEPSSSEPSESNWYSVDDDPDWRDGSQTSHSFHAANARTARYMLKAWRAGN